MPEPAAANPNPANPPAGNPPAGNQPAANAAWYGELPADRPAEFREWVTNKGFADPVSALESQFNLEKLLGADRAGRTLVLPKDENDVEGRKAYFAKIGVPESPDKYELPLPEGDNGEFSKVVASWFHEDGIPKAAAQKIAGKWNEYFGKMIKDAEAAEVAASEQALGKLKSEWGNDFTKNEELARRGLRQYGQKAGLEDGDLKTLETALGTAKMLKLFVALGSSTGEPGFAGGGSGGFGLSKPEAQQKLNQIRDDRVSGKITDKQWKDTYEAEVERLAIIVHGGT